VVYDQTDSFIHLNYLQNEFNLVGIINRQKLYLIDARVMYNNLYNIKFSSLE